MVHIAIDAYHAYDFKGIGLALAFAINTRVKTIALRGREGIMQNRVSVWKNDQRTLHHRKYAGHEGFTLSAHHIRHLRHQ